VQQVDRHKSNVLPESLTYTVVPAFCARVRSCDNAARYVGRRRILEPNQLSTAREAYRGAAIAAKAARTNSRASSALVAPGPTNCRALRRAGFEEPEPSVDRHLPDFARAMIYLFSLGGTRFQNSSKAIESKKAVALTMLPARISMNQA
jgi:hypothetical protein